MVTSGGNDTMFGTGDFAEIFTTRPPAGAGRSSVTVPREIPFPTKGKGGESPQAPASTYASLGRPRSRAGRVTSAPRSPSTDRQPNRGPGVGRKLLLEWRVVQRGIPAARTTSLSPALRRFRDINPHWHDLKHECASGLVEAGVPLAQVRDLLGHASTLTTGRYDLVPVRGFEPRSRG